MKTPRIWLQGLLALGAAYHILLGLLGVFGKARAPEVARAAFGFNLTPTPEIMWMLNPFVAYMLAFGAMLAVAATNPSRFRPVVYVAVGLFALRVGQRLVFAVSADPALQAVASPAQNFLHLGVVAVMAAAMLVLAMRLDISRS